MRVRPVLLGSAAILFLLTVTNAGSASPPFCPDGLLVPLGPPGQPVAYLVKDAYTNPENLEYSVGWGWWIYEESNGEPGLQRGGADLTGYQDDCVQSLNPDQAIY